MGIPTCFRPNITVGELIIHYEEHISDTEIGFCMGLVTEGVKNATLEILGSKIAELRCFPPETRVCDLPEHSF